MATFGLEVKNKYAISKINDIRTRLLLDDYIRNPFIGKIVRAGKDFYVVEITPIYHRFYLLFFVPLLMWLLFPSTWFGIAFLTISLFMLSFGVFWTPLVYYLMFYFVTKKGVRYVRPSKALSRVI